LCVSNIAGTLAGGQSFRLFSAAGFSGNFGSIVPAAPGPGLAWNFNPTNGTLSVLSLGPPQISHFAFEAGAISLCLAQARVASATASWRRPTSLCP